MYSIYLGKIKKKVLSVINLLLNFQNTLKICAQDINCNKRSNLPLSLDKDCEELYILSKNKINFQFLQLIQLKQCNCTGLSKHLNSKIKQKKPRVLNKIWNLKLYLHVK